MKPPALPTPPHQNAAYALIAAAFFAGIILAMLFAFASPSGTDAFGKVVLSVLILVFLSTVVAATLLLLKKKAGIIFCWICVPILVLNFPVGTIIAFYVASQIGKPGFRETLT